MKVNHLTPIKTPFKPNQKYKEDLPIKNLGIFSMNFPQLQLIKKQNKTSMIVFIPKDRIAIMFSKTYLKMKKPRKKRRKIQTIMMKYLKKINYYNLDLKYFISSC